MKVVTGEGGSSCQPMTCLPGNFRVNAGHCVIDIITITGYNTRMKEWKDVDGFDNYLVSNDGLVKHKRTGRISHGWVCSWGYRIVTMYNHGKKRGMSMHNLVAKAFIGDIPDGYVVNHIDGNKVNNNVNNLEIITISENNKHAFRTGLKKPTKCFGSLNGMHRSNRSNKK